MLSFTIEFVAFLPNLSEGNSSGPSLRDKFAEVLVECLTSSKSETRSATEDLLNQCLKNNVISFKSVTKGTGRLKPAQQRSVGEIIAKLEKGGASSHVGEDKEHKPCDSSKETTRTLPSVSSNKTVPRRETAREPTDVVEEATISSTHNASRAPIHPLMGNMSNGVMKRARASLRVLNWPEYPEEPTNSMFLGSLKKAWAPLLPLISVEILFPSSGIKKQDDGNDGCHLLSRAIAMEKSGEGEAFVEQLEFVLKWLTFVLCSRESTVGQQALLSLFLELFDYVKYCKYELSDADAAAIVPYLYEKASFSKVRSDYAHNEGLTDTYIPAKGAISRTIFGGASCGRV